MFLRTKVSVFGVTSSPLKDGVGGSDGTERAPLHNPTTGFTISANKERVPHLAEPERVTDDRLEEVGY